MHTYFIKGFNIDHILIKLFIPEQSPKSLRLRMLTMAVSVSLIGGILSYLITFYIHQRKIKNDTYQAQNKKRKDSCMIKVYSM